MDFGVSDEMTVMLAMIREFMDREVIPLEGEMLHGDPGALVSVAGAGVLASTDQEDDAQAFVDYLLSEDGQRFYVDEAEEAEYPLIEGIEPKEGLPPLDELGGPDVDLSSFGAELEATVELLRETGYLT